MLGNGDQHAPDEAFRRPICQRNPAAAPHHPRKLARRPLLIGRKHHAKRRQRSVERVGRERQLLGVTLQKVDRQPFRGRALAATLQKRRHVVQPDHATEAVRRRQRGVAVAARDIEHFRAGVELGRLA